MEISKSIEFSVEEKTLIDMHSVFNVMNIIIYELLTLSTRLGDPKVLNDLHESVMSIVEQLKDPEEAHRQVENVDDFISSFRNTISQAVFDAGKNGEREVIQSLSNIYSIFDILEVRAREITARQKDPDAWVLHDIRQLKNNFFNVFEAIEKNSRGKYRIVFNIAEQGHRDYLINFDITSVRGSHIWMPAVFQDVMRDLLANARKYTDPGGTILSGLYESDSELRFVVRDTGVGIPVDEIEDIIAFGRRGSNVKERPTRGGGFGLSKAYYITKKCKGRMWIESPLYENSGTGIEIIIPKQGPSKQSSRL